MAGWEEALDRFSCFPGLARKQRVQLAACVREVVLEAGQPLFLEGDPPVGLCLLWEGRIQLSRASADGKEHVVHRLERGTAFGEVMLFDRKPCPATATALVPSRVGVLSREDFLQLVRQEPELALGIMALMTERLRLLQSKLAAHALLDATGKVAAVILQLWRDQQAPGAGSDAMRVRRPPGQAHLAAMAGVSRETASRVLGHLQKNGVIGVEADGSWTIRNYGALCSWVLPESQE